MRLGKDALVLTQTTNSRSIAFLSQLLNEGKDVGEKSQSWMILHVELVNLIINFSYSYLCCIELGDSHCKLPQNWAVYGSG